MSLAQAEAVPEPHTSTSLTSALSSYEYANVEARPNVRPSSWRTDLQTPSGAAPVAFDAKSLMLHTAAYQNGKDTSAHAFNANNRLDVRPPQSSHTPIPRNHLLQAWELPSPPHLHGDTRVAVIGVGFVGASLLEEFMRPFPKAIGYDVSALRIDQLQRQYQSSSMRPLDQGLVLTTDANQLRQASHFLVAVPTLLQSESRSESSSEESPRSQNASQPCVNLDFVRSAVDTVLRHCRSGSVVVLESSVSVGTTRSLLGPYGHLVHAGMSPERVDPGRITPVPSAVPKLVSGLTPTATTAIAELYRSCYEHVLPVSSPEVAEMTKLHENSFRMINIAYANEVADACRSLGIKFKEVVDAARTKPYGFMPFSEGPGVGGHCIPVNPYYLFASCKKGALPLLERATREMNRRPRKLAKQFYRRVTLEMAKREGVRATDVCAKRSPRILVVGLGFKPGLSVLSFSPGLAFSTSLRHLKCTQVSFYDPLVGQDAVKEDASWLRKLSEADWHSNDLGNTFDGIAVCMKQHNVDWRVIAKSKVGQACYVRWYV